MKIQFVINRIPKDYEYLSLITIVEYKNSIVDVHKLGCGYWYDLLLLSLINNYIFGPYRYAIHKLKRLGFKSDGLVILVDKTHKSVSWFKLSFKFKIILKLQYIYIYIFTRVLKLYRKLRKFFLSP